MQSAKDVGFPTKDAPVMDGQSGASNSAAIQCKSVWQTVDRFWGGFPIHKDKFLAVRGTGTNVAPSGDGLVAMIVQQEIYGAGRLWDELAGL